MIIHLTGLKNVNNPGVLLFPRLLVCLDCGFMQYKVPGAELRLLGRRSSKSECSTRFTIAWLTRRPPPEAGKAESRHFGPPRLWRPGVQAGFRDRRWAGLGFWHGRSLESDRSRHSLVCGRRYSVHTIRFPEYLTSTTVLVRSRVAMCWSAKPKSSR